MDSKKILSPIAYQTAFNARLSNIAECFHKFIENLRKPAGGRGEGLASCDVGRMLGALSILLDKTRGEAKRHL